MEIKFNFDDNRQLNKPLKFHAITVIVISVFGEDGIQATQTMLEYDRIDISEGIDVNKTNASEECDICHYWYFKDIGFKYKPYLCNGCYDLMQKAMTFNNVAIVHVKGSAYRIHFWYMGKDEVYQNALW